MTKIDRKKLQPKFKSIETNKICNEETKKQLYEKETHIHLVITQPEQTVFTEIQSFLYSVISIDLLFDLFLDK